MTSKKLETAAKLYLVASQMNTDLTMATMRMIYWQDSDRDILNALTKAKRQVRKLATTPRRLRDSALTKLVRHDGTEDTVRINMARHHPCNTPEQIERAILSACPNLYEYDSDHTCTIFSFRGFYHECAFGTDTPKPPLSWPEEPAGYSHNAGPAWSAAFARICDVFEERDGPHGYCKVVDGPVPVTRSDGMDLISPRIPEPCSDKPTPLDIFYDSDRRRIVASAKTFLIRRYGNDSAIRKSMTEAYSAKSDIIDWAIAEGTKLLRADMAGIDISEIERFAWIQAVCGLFGRKNIRDWVVREYPYADPDKMDRAIKNASEKLANDIKMAGPEAAIPGAMHQYVAAGKDAKTALNNAKEQWDYLDDDTVCRIFAELDKSDI